jgi:acetyltransferase-like isoleucine patch superfamily enzyme
MPVFHPSAVVESTHVSPDATIDAYAVVGPRVVIGAGVHVHAGVVLIGEIEIGAGTEVFPGAVIGKPRATSVALSRQDAPSGPVRIGARCSIGAHAVIAGHVSIGDDCLVGDGASIRERCTIGRRVIVGRAVSLHPDCCLDDGARLLDGAHAATASRIGRDCFISVGVIMVSDPALGREPFDADRVRGPRIGDRVSVGAGAILLSGIVIGDDATIAAGAVVTRDVEAGSHMRGLPARVLPRP